MLDLELNKLMEQIELEEAKKELCLISDRTKDFKKVEATILSPEFFAHKNKYTGWTITDKASGLMLKNNFSTLTDAKDYLKTLTTEELEKINEVKSTEKYKEQCAKLAAANIDDYELVEDYYYSVFEALEEDGQRNLFEKVQVSLNQKTLSCILYYSEPSDNLYFYQPYKRIVDAWVEAINKDNTLKTTHKLLNLTATTINYPLPGKRHNWYAILLDIVLNEKELIDPERLIYNIKHDITNKLELLFKNEKFVHNIGIGEKTTQFRQTFKVQTAFSTDELQITNIVELINQSIINKKVDNNLFANLYNNLTTEVFHKYNLDQNPLKRLETLIKTNFMEQVIDKNRINCLNNKILDFIDSGWTSDILGKVSKQPDFKTVKLITTNNNPIQIDEKTDSEEKIISIDFKTYNTHTGTNNPDYLLCYNENEKHLKLNKNMAKQYLEDLQLDETSLTELIASLTKVSENTKKLIQDFSAILSEEQKTAIETALIK